jgi:shikimate dehydrogenase
VGHGTRLGVLGWPVAHSRSPQMHNAALQAVGLSDWRYQLLPVPPELFAETVAALPQAGFRGANVTIPHKQAALELADDASEAARAIGAANTLVFDDAGGIYAENTDAPALIAALPFGGEYTTALVLGAGGAARAAVWALLRAGAGDVRVWNRHPVRARQLCAELGGTPVTEAGAADVLVNCTAVGLERDAAAFKQLPVQADELAMFKCVVDLVYASDETPLVRAANSLGVPVVDGLDLLAGQGALSFELFTGRPAPLEQMRAAARGR